MTKLIRRLAGPAFEGSQIQKSNAAINSWGGWFDASTADAVIRSFMTLSNYQRAVIGPWNHGGGQNASPYQGDQALRVMQGYEWLRFFEDRKSTRLNSSH